LLQLGATQAAGVDIDPLSISASRQNAERNGLSPQTLRVYLADRDSAGSFDIVVANVMINPLVALASRIAGYAKPGVGIALSGVLEEQVDEVVRTYEKIMNHIEVTTEGGWACVSGRKR
jgi:ribosomal protein L11 methyltransferase